MSANTSPVNIERQQVAGRQRGVVAGEPDHASVHQFAGQLRLFAAMAYRALLPHELDTTSSQRRRNGWEEVADDA